MTGYSLIAPIFSYFSSVIECMICGQYTHYTINPFYHRVHHPCIYLSYPTVACNLLVYPRRSLPSHIITLHTFNTPSNLIIFITSNLLRVNTLGSYPECPVAINIGNEALNIENASSTQAERCILSNVLEIGSARDRLVSSNPIGHLNFFCSNSSSQIAFQAIARKLRVI